MELLDRARARIDLDRPSVARVYDYYLGGSHNFAADREMAEQAIAMWPELPRIIQANRAFLRRAVQYLIGQGIRQFLDLGSGIPTVGNVHEVAQRAAPDARVVYVDIDPVAVTYGQALLADNPLVESIHADLRDPEGVLSDSRVRNLLDLSQPVAVLMVAVLHFVPDEENPDEIVAHYRDEVVPGSYFALSHATADDHPELGDSHRRLYDRTATPMTMRTRAAVARFLDGWDVVEPGLVHTALWRPDPYDDREARIIAGYAAMGRKQPEF